MAPLSRDEIRELAFCILRDLSNTVYACSSVGRVTGGSAGFTFRGTLQSPLFSSDGTIRTSVILKKATDFAAINSDFALDATRSMYEDIMLRALVYLHPRPATDTVSVCVPQTFAYFKLSQIQIIEDLQPAKDLASILKSATDVSVCTDFTAIGLALGSWLRYFHIWAQAPDQDVLRQMMRENEASRLLKWETTYNNIVDIAKKFPMLRSQDVDVLNAVRLRVLQEHEQASTVPQDREFYGLIHADLWAGNILFNPKPNPQLYIIDFEFAHIGHRATDLGQIIGDLLEKSYMSRDDLTQSNCEALLESFVKGYGAMDENLAYRIVVHAGVHMINWCARHPGADLKGKAAGLMQKAVAIIVRAWRKDSTSFDGDVLGCLFSRSNQNS